MMQQAQPKSAATRAGETRSQVSGIVSRPDPLPGLHDDLGVLAAALTARDRAASPAAARKAAVAAVESVD
jgi:hypothetical protein